MSFYFDCAFAWVWILHRCWYVEQIVVFEAPWSQEISISTAIEQGKLLQRCTREAVQVRDWLGY